MSLLNEDELNPLSWMDQQFFEKVLIEYEKDESIKIVNIDISPASMKGDHYASVMFRAIVEFRSSDNGPTAKRSMIVKTIPEMGMKRELLLMSSVFETEIEMYTKTIPKIELILRAHDDSTQLAPKIIYHSLSPNKLIILEDACELGYITIRGRFLNELEVRAVYTKLAKLHAVSYMLGKSEQHALVDSYQQGICSNSLFVASEMISKGIVRFIDMLSAHEEFSEYIPKFKAIQPKLFDVCKHVYRAHSLGEKDELYVLNHGDFHMKNLMFKFAKKTQLEDLLMVDLQICVYGPSIIDVMYSTFTILSPELRKNYKVFWHHYWDEFISTLKQIKFEGELPQYSQLKMASLKYKHFAILMLTTFLPINIAITTMDSEELKKINWNDLVEKADGHAFYYRNPIYVDEVRRLLPQLLHDGFLD